MTQQTDHIGDTNKMVEHHIVETNKMITAVEWLIQEIRKDVFVHSKSTKEWNETFKQAKAMEKEQIAKAFNEGMLNSVDYFGNGVDESEQYYNENYNK
jgi:hypothetical protein